MKILIVDDDFLELDFLRAQLSGQFPAITIETIETENDFRRALSAIRANPPNLIILDMLLRYANIGEETPNLEEEGGYFRAGLRCRELLASFPETKDIPVIFYSMLERSDAFPESRLPMNTFYSTKSDETFDLSRKVRSLLTAQEKMTISSRLKDQVFISYSHKDQKFLDEFLVHLKPLERAKRVTHWSDRQIKPGEKWFDEIRQALASSKVVVMLLSSNFLASDFIHEHELGPILKEAEKGGLRILWIMVRACSYQETALKDYQAVLPLDKPLAEMKAERDGAWVEICKAIKKAVE